MQREEAIRGSFSLETALGFRSKRSSAFVLAAEGDPQSSVGRPTVICRNFAVSLLTLIAGAASKGAWCINSLVGCPLASFASASALISLSRYGINSAALLRSVASTWPFKSRVNQPPP